MQDFPNLLSPIDIGPVTMRNRVLVSAHVPGLAENNRPGQRYINYHREYAKNGVGLQLTGGTPVHRSGMLSLTSDALWNMDDNVIPGYRALADAVHEQGGRILAQLAHSAGTVRIDRAGYQSWAASPVRSRSNGNVSHEMTKSEIDEVIQAHVAAARRVVEGGLDGVEILAAFGFLPQAFLSPLTNWREDEYGGNLESRMTFLIQLLEAVRTATGDRFVLGIRLPGDEFEPGGLTLDDMKIVCRRLSDLGLVDYFNVIAHTNISATGRSKHWAPTPTPHGIFVPLAEAIKAVVSEPVFAVGRVVDPRHAEQIIAAGKADMVGMTRAHICDPQIVSKIVNNVAERIRPCVGANNCIANRYAGKPLSCMHNPALALSSEKDRKITQKKRIAILGAGPAGLEATRVTAERGHDVTLFETQNKPGGQLALWAGSASTHELTRIIDWRVAELKRLGVPVHYNTSILSDDLEDQNYDVIIVATGALPRPSHLLADDTVPILSPHSVISMHGITARSALVFNEGRGQAGLVAAELLLDRGASVELVTSDFAVAADLDPTVRDGWYARLGKRGVTMTSQNQVESIDNGHVTLRNIHCGAVTERHNVDLLVDWSGCVAEDSVLGGTENLNGSVSWFAVGDCVAPRNAEVAMAEAQKLARSI